MDSNHSSANVFDIRAGSAPAMEAPVLSDQNATLQQRRLRRKRRRGMEAPQVPRAQARTREDALARGTQQSTNRRERGLSAATSRRVLLGELSDMGTTVPPMESRRARRILIPIRSYRAHISRSGNDMLVVCLLNKLTVDLRGVSTVRAGIAVRRPVRPHASNRKVISGTHH